ncbi:DUF6520 family protein [Sinomicrobium oceani]|nr:DUF6520 family protein [Sinomicrobium oceani]
MKKFKFLLGSAAFLVAVGGAFASKTINNAPSLQQLYEEIGDDCDPSNCAATNTGPQCDAVYFDDECTDPVGFDTFRPLP